MPRRKAKRKRVSKDLEREVYRFYGGRRCVVSEVDLLSVQLHHLDERPSNTRFANLVPLRADFNQSLEHWHPYAKKPRSRLPHELDLSALDSRARHCFDRGLHRVAYGCARLGSYIALKIGDHDQAVDFACNALANARAIGEARLGSATLRTLVDRVKWAKTGVLTRSRLLLEMASFSVHEGAPRADWRKLRFLAYKAAEETKVARRRGSELRRFLRLSDGRPQLGTRLVGHTWWTRVEALLAFAEAEKGKEREKYLDEARLIMGQAHIVPTQAIERFVGPFPRRTHLAAALVKVAAGKLLSAVSK